MRTKEKVKRTVKYVLVPDSRKFWFARRIAVKVKLLDPVPPDSRYAEWVERTEPYTWSLPQDLKYKPKISVVVPVFNPPAYYFFPMVYSVINQTYSDWELVLVNASTKKLFRQQTEASVSIDNRIKLVNLSKNEGIAGNTNAGIEAATGEYITLLDHDDLLSPNALYEMVLALQTDQSASMVYSDEDKISEDGTDRFDPHFKPDWSPQLLRQVNYINHFSMINRKLLMNIGGYRKGFEGAQDYDLYLRIIDENPNVLHVPKVLYHWRIAATSTARNFSVKKNILEAGVKALSDHIKRNHIDGTVKAVKNQPGFYRIKYELKHDDIIAVVLMPADPKAQYKKIVEYYTQHNSGYGPNIEFIVGSIVEKIDGSSKNKIIYINETEPSALLREAYKESTAKIFIVINVGALPISKEWAYNLARPLLQDPKIGTVTPLIVDNDKSTVYDSGLARQGNTYVDVYKGHHYGAHTYFGNTNWVRNVNTITGRCFAIRRETIEVVLRCFDKTRFLEEKFDEEMCQANLQVCINSFVKLHFAGDLHLNSIPIQFFNPNMTEVRSVFSVSRMVNIPEVDDDE